MTEWKTYRLGEIGKIVTGKTPRTSQSEYFDGDIPFITPADLNTPFKRILSTQRTLTIEGLNSIKGCIIPANSIAVSCIGNLGYVGITNQICATNQQINTIIVNNQFDSHFIYYTIKHLWPYFKNLEGQSTTLSILNKTQFSQIEISLPSLEEQRRIAGILGAIDDKIENNRRINDNLEQQAQALYKQWFVDNRNDDWKEIKLGDIIEISKKSTTPAQSENTIFEHYSLPAFDDGIQPVFEKGKYIKSSKFILEQNMFLFSKLNPRIKRIWLPDIQTENAICSTEFIPYKPKDIAMFGFCYSIVNSDSFYEYVLSLTNGSTGSHQRFHPIDTLDYELTIPNNDYIAKFEELVMPIYRTIARNRMECKNLATLRDTLLPKLMNGEIKTGGNE